MQENPHSGNKMEKETKPDSLFFLSSPHESQSLVVILNQHLQINKILSKHLGEREESLLALCDKPLKELLDLLQINTDLILTTLKRTQNTNYEQIELSDFHLQQNYMVSVIKSDSSYILVFHFINRTNDALKTYINTIINNLPGAVYWKDKEGRYMGCNQFVAQMAGFKKPEDLIGKTDFDLCWNEFAKEWRELDVMVMNENKTIKREEQAKLKDGAIITELTFKTPLYNEKNEIVGIIGTSLDITEQKKLEEALRTAKEKAEAANRAKDEFIRNMSHDIRTPLSGIIGMSSILEQEAQSVDAKEHAHMINISGEQLLSLLNSVLDIIASGSQKENQVNLSTFCISNLIHNLADLELPTFRLKKLDLRIKLAPDLPQLIETDQIKIHRILLNILGNALKFTEQGYIEIGVALNSKTQKKNRIEFYIKDTGAGIKPEDQDKIFKKFFRGTPSSQGIYTGHGVGLHIVKKYIQLLRGDIKVESQLNKGTTFIISIPIKVIEMASLPHPSQVIPVCASPSVENKNLSSAIQILLIEDNAIALKTAENIISKMNLGFHSAANGAKAIELFKKQPFDLVFSDIGLPDISGLEVTKRIRSVKYTF